jgi:hypothetical protein
MIVEQALLRLRKAVDKSKRADGQFDPSPAGDTTSIDRRLCDGDAAAKADMDAMSPLSPCEDSLPV